MMSKIKEAENFIQKIRDLIGNRIQNVKEKEVILLIGPTGSGKSTILNMIAGSKITCNKKSALEWQINGDPNIAVIGHVKSETFLPNFWEDQHKNRYYDCPGFNDTKGIEYEIAKSYIMKKIADNAVNLKIILVCDFFTFMSSRCGDFERILQQIKSFLPNLNIRTDSLMIITKASPDISSSDIADTLEKQLNIDYPSAKIYMLPVPDNKTKQLTYINFTEIIKKIPSINSQQSKLSFSAQAKQRIHSLKSQFYKEIRIRVYIVLKRINIHYESLIYNNLQASNDLIQEYFFCFKRILKNFNVFASPRQFMKIVFNQIYNLTRADGHYAELNLEQQLQKFQKNIQNFCFISEMESSEDQKQNWRPDIQVTYETLNKSNNKSRFKSIESFSNYLRSRYIDPSLNIKTQIHNILNVKHKFQARYDGIVKDHKGVLNYEGVQISKQKTPYTGFAQFKKDLQYAGTIHCKGNKQYKDKISTPMCTHSKSEIALFNNIKCMLCNHNGPQNIDVSYEGTVPYDEVKSYSGSVSYQHREPYEGIVQFQLQLPLIKQIQYVEDVPYNGTHQVTCQDHHECSCKELSAIALSAKELLEDIKCYNQIIQIQRQKLLKMHSSKEEFKAGYFQSSFFVRKQSIFEYNSENSMAQKIHDLLTTRYAFQASYEGKRDYPVSRKLQGMFKEEGIVPYIKPVSHKKNVRYEGVYRYEETKKYNGTVQIKSCYSKNCILCSSRVNTHNRQYSGSITFPVSKQYSGSVNFSQDKQCTGYAPYKCEIPYSHQIRKTEKVDFKGSHTVECIEGKLDSGHHTCDSCDVWSRFIPGLIALLKEKQTRLELIRKQREQIKKQDEEYNE